MKAITGEVCYRSTTLSMHENYVHFGLLENSTITFQRYPGDESTSVAVKISDLITVYNEKNPAVSDKIVLGLQNLRPRFIEKTVVDFCYEELWLHMPKHSNGLNGVISEELAKTKSASSVSIISKIFCGHSKIQ